MFETVNLPYIALGAVVVLLLVFSVALLRRRRRLARSAAPPAPPEPIAFLERPGDDDKPHVYALHKPVVIIGRSADSDIRIPPELPGAASVSRRHAQIRREDLDFIVEDLGSQNGIRVNGLVTHRNLLRDGYRLSFGSVEFTFHAYDPNITVRNVT
ncbi:MAG TPA: FHA domain-containing protein [Anaerolineae bacterium]|nr:FHA domain-containing protein [Anaerolineae bacterium]